MLTGGSTKRGPWSMRLADGSVVVIVDEEGVVQGAITPTSITDDTTVATDKKIQFRDTGIYINSGADGKLTISADGSGADDITLDGTVALADNATLATDKKLLFRDTGLFIHSSADGKLTISADGSGADDITLAGTVSVSDNITLATDKQLFFRDTGIYIRSGSDGKLSIVADGGGADDITLSGGVTIAGSVAATGTHTQTGAVIATVGLQATATARTATADGTTTGTIAANTSHVTVTSDNADKIIILPTPTPGVKVTLYVGSTGFELRSSSPATISINGGSGASAESAIAANSTVYMTCVSATAWVGFQQAADGTVTAVEAAA